MSLRIPAVSRLPRTLPEFRWPVPRRGTPCVRMTLLLLTSELGHTAWISRAKVPMYAELAGFAGVLAVPSKTRVLSRRLVFDLGMASEDRSNVGAERLEGRRCLASRPSAASPCSRVSAGATGSL